MFTATAEISARAGHGAAEYPPGIQTCNGTTPTLAVNPINAST